jgi:putative transport protein
MAIIGIIGTLVILKQVFRVDPPREAAEFAAKARRQVEPLERHTLIVTNPNLDGMQLAAIPGRVRISGDYFTRPPP